MPGRRTPVVTALRRKAPGRIEIELDGAPWRAVPDEVVVRCGLRRGSTLERPVLRTLRRELRRAEALTRAGRALARRDFSTRELDDRLRRAGVRADERTEAVGVLTAAGVLDDERTARRRATALAERGWGNAAIRARLEGEGIGATLAEEALSGLPPERERAGLVVKPGLDPRKAAALLARRGFDDDIVAATLAPLDLAD